MPPWLRSCRRTSRCCSARTSFRNGGNRCCNSTCRCCWCTPRRRCRRRAPDRSLPSYTPHRRRCRRCRSRRSPRSRRRCLRCYRRYLRCRRRCLRCRRYRRGLPCRPRRRRCPRCRRRSRRRCRRCPRCRRRCRRRRRRCPRCRPFRWSRLGRRCCRPIRWCRRDRRCRCCRPCHRHHRRLRNRPTPKERPPGHQRETMDVATSPDLFRKLFNDCLGTQQSRFERLQRTVTCNARVSQCRSCCQVTSLKERGSNLFTRIDLLARNVAVVTERELTTQ